MSFKYIRDTYGVPAKKGGRIIFTDNNGTKFYCTIKSTINGKLRVLVDDRVPNYRGRLILHPTFNIEYLNEVQP